VSKIHDGRVICQLIAKIVSNTMFDVSNLRIKMLKTSHGVV